MKGLHQKAWLKGYILVTSLIIITSGLFAQGAGTVLSTDKLVKYVSYFNAIDTETVKNHVPNSQAISWMSANIPLFESPDTTLTKIYYYRWWAVRKHLKQTPDGYVFTEFITPMNHGGKHNTISSALGHHIYEGRWLIDQKYMNDYIRFWLYVDKQTPKPHLHAFSSWLQDAIYNRYLVNSDKGFIEQNLLELNADYNLWEQEKQLPDGKFWQFDVRDAMEESISGGRKEKNVRPTINSYMYGNARAMVAMAKLVGNDSLVQKYERKATQLKSIVQDYLWNDTSAFFEVRHENGKFAKAREAIGFIPWYFNLPDDKAKYAKQWDQLSDTTGFRAPWGLTTAEIRHPEFRTHGSGHGCEWDGAVWPFATTQTLRGLANLLSNYKQKGTMNSNIFYDELHKYAWSHQKNGLPYLGEYQDEKTGYWLKGDNPRSSYYNHSAFADLIISDLVGLKPRADNIVELKPLIPRDKWDWFCVDKIPYHGKLLTILYDKTGTRYNKGKGFMIFADGRQIYKGKTVGAIRAKM
ncbi:glycoside hydrolase [Segetibacter sp. 3557_3]|uniref:MGH1-like glycoside hydrolase domain-containing protein n=1 Tax=Segetibacter sp. 3557_3 TaxID=2547429 RepID=UPI0010591B23|nr:trehalase family glycosidase [Segetibacter sp. 3557_3]TDH28817.1 glycoside hydrolase [Segetibacter sp. 3557_3]